MQSTENTALVPNDQTSARVEAAQTPPAKLRTVATVVLLVGAYIGLSSTLINYNKFLMEGVFPYPVALTWLHMASSFVFSYSLYVVFGRSLFPSMEHVRRRPHKFFGKVLPIALCFGGSVVLSNEAYVYCSVPFLQLCKELNIVLVYLLSLAVGLDRYSGRTLVLLVVIMFGCSVGIEGELNFSRTGFGIQLAAQACEVLRIVIQQYVMQGMCVEPLTMVLLMSPLCLLAISTVLYTFWAPELLLLAQVHWAHLVLNCLAAFALNVCVATLIMYCSGVAYVLAGVVKDVVIVLTACLVFHASVSRLQGLGFAVAVLGVGLHSLLRMVPDIAEKGGVLGTLKWLVCGRNLTDEYDYLEKGDKRGK